MVKVDKKNCLFVTGVVIANGVKDTDGDILYKEDIKKLISSFLSQKTDTNHDFLENYGIKIIENYVSKVEETIGNKTVPEGSWICKMMIWDENLKRSIRQGKYTGLSLACQPDDDVQVDDVFNKRHTYSQFKDIDSLTPMFISIVKNPANGFNFDYYSYDTYITKSKMEAKSVSDENRTEMSILATKLVDAFLQENKTLREGMIMKQADTTAEESSVVKAAPPQGGVAPQQQPTQPQYGQPVSLEQVIQKLDLILQILNGGQQSMKSAEDCSKLKEKDVKKAEDKKNDETQEPETDAKDSHNEGKVSTDGKDDVSPSTETEGDVPSNNKKKRVLKSEAPKTEHVENINSTSNVYSQQINPIQGTPRDYLGRPIRN